MNSAQAPPLGSAAGFVLFSTTGAVGNTGISHITGNVGTNSGAITGFGNVNGVMNTVNGATAQCAADLLIAYNLLNSAVPTFFPAPLLGNGQVLNAGVYSISGAATLNLDLTLNAQGNPGAVFIFKIQGPFSTGASSKVHLINGALACNVFWKIEGLVSMAAGTTMRGTVIANNAAINMNIGDTLEGRVMSTAGAVNVLGVLAYTPTGCGSPVLTGPAAPALGSAGCYALFSSNGPVSNAGVTYVTGDVGTNVGLTTGFNPLFVTGTVHPIADGSTAQCAADLGIIYTYLNTLPNDIELLYPAQFGHNLVLTPHTYLMNAAATFTDTLYLDAQGVANAVFVIKINGALSTGTYAKVVLINGTLAKNVYWKVDGAVTINDYSVFKGTVVCNNGAMLLKTGVVLEGRALTTTGSLGTMAVTATMPPGCGTTSAPAITTQPVNKATCAGTSVSFSVVASGTSLSYQWRKGALNLSNGGNISGANSATLTINPASTGDAGSNYNVVVTGTFLPGITSSNVSLAVNPSPVPTIGSTNNPCQGSANNIYYSESGQSNYLWTVSQGSIVSGQGTSTLNVTWTGIGAQNVSVNYSNSNGCYAVAPAVYNLFVNSMPEAAGAVTGAAQLCAGTTGIAYSTNPVRNAESYIWTLPSGATIATGAGTTAITVDYAAAAVSGNIMVAGNNSCGNGPPSVFAVTVNPLPAAAGAISGPVMVCAGTIGVAYSIPAIAAAAGYVWSVPSGVVITSGATGNQILVNFGSVAGSGAITVMGTNGCGNGTPSPGLIVTTNAIPSTPVVTLSGSVVTSSAPAGNQWYYEGTAIAGATGQTYTVTNNSGYYWCMVTENGCPSGISNKVWILVTGTQDLPVSASFTLYPVPNNGEFTAAIRFPVDDIFTILVYNQFGGKLFERRDIHTTGGRADTQVDLRPVSNGAYSVILLNSEYKVVKRILVNN
ncbi:MAG: ice-binding family protein [Bacteroidota bacterium]